MTQDFLNYFREFYGPEGLYPDTIPGYQDCEVIDALKFIDNFEGDTWDRERVRDYILRTEAKQGVV